MPPPSIFIDARDLRNEMQAFWHPSVNQIQIGATLTADPDAVCRAYCHYLLLTSKPAYLMDTPADPELGDIAAIESGLADYLVCSFRGDPRFGVIAAQLAAQRSGFAGEALRDLTSNALLSIGLRRTQYQSGGEAWGAVLWDIRGILNPRETDRLAVEAWRDFDLLSEQPAVAFSAILVQRVGSTLTTSLAAKVRHCFEQRGLEPRAQT